MLTSSGNVPFSHYFFFFTILTLVHVYHNVKQHEIKSLTPSPLALYSHPLPGYPPASQHSLTNNRTMADQNANPVESEAAASSENQSYTKNDTKVGAKEEEAKVNADSQATKKQQPTSIRQRVELDPVSTKKPVKPKPGHRVVDVRTAEETAEYQKL
ncbi:hypothetical protein BU26DRAFT_262193 [Trematosphaeria pertusa]|uniref:Uncharacterized protein n=1 Tax=Trematosphaeria pertusa TaxID=390896 RepID=A0A6A6IRI2_9PLEO|nr:uncharacterized protein BU26DRAFT_262193 [Trematosphaeria pertusa]KAF2252688.1 hypothetical protein BU26DRAFT_262193 [Trematosphaeria pertusa]